MNFFSAMDAAASAMTAERCRMDLISQNIANANTSNTLAGEPYRRKVAVVQQGDASTNPMFSIPVSLDDDDPEDGKTTFGARGVKIAGVVEDKSDFKYVYDPTNPNAIREGKMKGYVAMPNVNVITEMTSMIAATRSYDANATVVDAVKQMAQKGLEIGKGG